MRLRRLLAVVVGVAAVGCAHGWPKPQRPAIGTVQVGVASWYGPGYHGKRAANGEVYDQDGFTAAHRFWAFGTRVRVTSLVTGTSVVVRINDRFPRRDRVIDLSRGAARRLSMIGPGTARVRLEVVG
jgi:rare lipoprotein A